MKLTPALMHLVSQYKELTVLEKLQFIEQIYALDRHKVEYTIMPASLRHWYESFKGE